MVFVLHLPAPLCLTTPSRSSSQLDAPPSLLPALCLTTLSRSSMPPRHSARESRPSQPPNVETFHTNGGTFTTDVRGRGPARGPGRGRGSWRGRGRSPRRGGGVGPDVVNGALRNLASYLPRVGGSPSAPLTSALALLGNATGEWAEGTSLRPAAVLPVCCACPRTGQVPRLAPARSLLPALPDAQPCNRPSVRTPAQHHLTTCVRAQTQTGGAGCSGARGGGGLREEGRDVPAARTTHRAAPGCRGARGTCSKPQSLEACWYELSSCNVVPSSPCLVFNSGVTVSHSSSHSELARSLKAVLVCTSSSRASKLCWFVQALCELVPARSLVRARPRSKPRSCAGLYVQLRNSTARATVQYSQTRSTTVRQSVHGHGDTSQLPRT